jgi:hypothetical protein
LLDFIKKNHFLTTVTKTAVSLANKFKKIRKNSSKIAIIVRVDPSNAPQETTAGPQSPKKLGTVQEQQAQPKQVRERNEHNKTDLYLVWSSFSFHYT